MRFIFVRYGRLLALGAVALVLACHPDVTDAPIDHTRITLITISGCGTVVQGEACPISARAWNADGEEIENPTLIWSSTSPNVAQVQRSGTETRLVGLRVGQTTIRASDATRTVITDFPVRVTPRRA